MADFQYTAKTAGGETVTGVLSAESEATALRILDERNLFPLALRNGSGAAARQAARRRVRTRDVGIMYGQLADLIGAGVPLLRALDSLVKSTVNARLAGLLREVRAGVADGKSLTDALREHPETFPPLHTAMVQAGERASFLEDVLQSLSGFLERLDELRSKVIGALIYPALLAGVGTLVLVGALLFFVPRFEPLLGDARKPLPTELVFWLSGVLRGYWYLALAAGAGLGALVWGALASERGRRWYEEWRLRVPVVGTALRLLGITRFCRILGTLLANGVPLLQALSISRGATGSRLLGDRIADAMESVRGGRPLTEPLRVGNLFPEQILAMIRVAEESNRLDKVLLKIADTVERRTNRQVDQVVRLLEPLILCLVAMAIGVLALGLLLPIFTMASNLGRAS
ncbi:MAG TPA: type II secretion system F family protein [Verrucomicrobiota bacterium]|nr:type II secretion system F family protein [Verrucomicrobiota bacterium]HRZ36992.1 type II secretion system F family protein [Candidatus Paceibacterota bacterium]